MIKVFMNDRQLLIMINFLMKPHNSDTSKLIFFFSFFLFFLSSSSNENLTFIPTNNSIPVHCEPYEPEEFVILVINHNTCLGHMLVTWLL